MNYQEAGAFLKQFYNNNHINLPYTQQEVADYVQRFQNNYSPKRLVNIDRAKAYDYLFSDYNSMLKELKRKDRSISFALGLVGTQGMQYFPFREKDGKYIVGDGVLHHAGESVNKEQASALASILKDQLIDCCSYIETHLFNSVPDYEAFNSYAERNMGSVALYAWAHKYFQLIYPHLFTEFHTIGLRQIILECFGITPLKTPYGSEGQLCEIWKNTGISDSYLFAYTIYSSVPEITAYQKSGKHPTTAVVKNPIQPGIYKSWQVQNNKTLLLNCSPETIRNATFEIPAPISVFFETAGLNEFRTIHLEYNKNNYTAEIFLDDNNLKEIKFCNELTSVIGDMADTEDCDIILLITSNRRNVYTLSLLKGETHEIRVPESEQEQILQAQSLSENKLCKIAKQREISQPEAKTVTTVQRNRDPYIAEYAKLRAKGICQLCDCAAPFSDAHGKPYLETHHIVPLADGGEDTIKNTIALCPNCHRKIHILKLQDDVDKLRTKNESV